MSNRSTPNGTLRTASVALAAFVAIGLAAERAAAPAEPQAGTAAADFFTALTANPELTLFAQAYLTAGMEERLDPAQEWTVFAPDDTALATDQALESAEELTYYIVPGSYSEDDLWRLAEEHGGSAPLMTLGGEEITVDIIEGFLRIAGAALITQANIEVANGYVHVLDAALPMAAALDDGA